MAGRRITLTKSILISLVLGVAAGLVVHQFPQNLRLTSWLVDGVFATGGQLFLRGITMLVTPLVLVSITAGVAKLGDLRNLGRVGARIVLFYMFTTMVAVTAAVTIASLIQPGAALDLTHIVQEAPAERERFTVVQMLLEMVPTNPFRALVEGNMLQIIIFSLLCGIGLSALGERGASLVTIVDGFNDVLLKVVGFVMLYAPFGVFCLVAKTFATTGFTAMVPLAKYMGTVVLVLAVQFFVVYGGLLTALTRLNPLRFFRKIFPAFTVAFSTSSSYATLPVTLKVAEENLGVAEEVAAFTVPLGATINMDGTAIMQGVATVFTAEVFGVHLGIGELVTVVITATLASIGTAGVPAVGLVMLTMVLQSVGLPIEGIGIIMGIDRILDMTRTAVNVTGDTVCTTIVAKQCGEFDETVFAAD